MQGTEKRRAGAPSIFLPKIFLFFLAFALFSIFSSSLALAQPPQVNTASDLGFTLEIPKIDTLAQNGARIFHFHVFNSTDGYPITNNTSPGVSCEFNLYSSTSGQQIAALSPIISERADLWQFTLPGSNFSTPGVYSMIAHCNDTYKGGFVSEELTVTPTGFENSSLTLLILALVSIFFLVLGIYFEEVILYFFAGITLVLTGMWTIVYGFNNVANIYTWGAGVVIIGFAILILINPILVIFGQSSSSTGSSEDDEEE